MLQVYTHAACAQHDPGAGHAESPQRLQAVLEALDSDQSAALTRLEAPRATRAQLGRVHDDSYIAQILDATPTGGPRQLDADTAMSAGSAEAALRAAGAAVAAVDAALQGAATRAFCAVRPPGHHATRDRAMGFCLFNNVAVAAAHALSAHGLARIAIADFDVHHGNGTQAIFAHEPRVLYASSHQSPLYPGTGSVSGPVAGNVCNAPLAPGSGSTEFRAAWSDVLLPRLDALAPQLVLISAGFDADRRDPLAALALDPDDFTWITRQLVELADRHANGRIVSCLEGGYDLAALREGVAAHVAALQAT